MTLTAATQTQRRIISRTLALLVAALGTGFPAVSQAVFLPSASAQATATCGTENAPIGPAPFGVRSECDDTVDFGNGISVQTQAMAQADIGVGFPLIGMVQARASVTAVGYGVYEQNENHAGGDAHVSYYFYIEAYRQTPFNPPNLDVYFEGAASGYSHPCLMSFQIGAEGFGTFYNDDPCGDSIAVNMHTRLTPGVVRQVYLDASCIAFATGQWDPETFEPITVTDDCEVTADPVIGFDQAAFDARYGANSFVLTDYYRMTFSENAVVPLPSGIWLLGTGIVTLLGRAARRRRC